MRKPALALHTGEVLLAPTRRRKDDVGELGQDVGVYLLVYEGHTPCVDLFLEHSLDRRDV